MKSLRVWEACFAADTHAEKSLWVSEACFIADTHTEKSLWVSEACLVADTQNVKTGRYNKGIIYSRRPAAGVRRITAKVKTVICEQAPNHGSYFAYARLCFRNFQFTQSQSVSGIHSPFLFYSSVPDAPGRSDSGEYPDPAYAKHLREVSVLRLPNW